MPDIYHPPPSLFRALLPIWFLAVLWGSLTSEAKLESMEDVLLFLAWSDKLLHFGAYFGLAALCLLSLGAGAVERTHPRSWPAGQPSRSSTAL